MLDQVEEQAGALKDSFFACLGEEPQLEPGFERLQAAFAILIVPQWASLVSRVALPMELAEAPIILWLVIWGARQRPTEAAAAG